MSATYDAIVVGARCAGAPTAMLLARRGHRVLLVDRARFPSDTISTHIVHGPGVAALRRWGLLERLQATALPAIRRYSLDFGPFAIAGSPRSGGEVAPAICPRRTVLDDLLVQAAVEAGAELQEGFRFEGVLEEAGRVVGIRGRTRGRRAVQQRARVVIGADGRHSAVARAVAADAYNERPVLAAGYYAYWSGFPAEAFEGYVRPGRAIGLAPTNDGLTMVTVNWPHAEFAANRRDLERHYMETIGLAAPAAERAGSARRETRIAGAGDLPGYFRTPYGPGWALVGDAGYHKDPLTAQGISDAFRDAERLVAALDDALAGVRPFEGALASYRRARDEASMPMFEFTCELAALEPPPPPMQRLLSEVSRSQSAQDDFVSMMAALLPVPQFFGRYGSAPEPAPASGHAALARA